jgi:hypothetical protein
MWRVVANDTNQTPVFDSEPAYHLLNVSRNNDGYHRARYAYQSDLELVPLVEGLLDELIGAA